MTTSQEISDSLVATGSYYSKDDFSGRALFYSSVRETEPIPVDLLIQEVDFTLAEYLQISPFLGSFFGATALGWQPMMANISATLMDSDFNYGKQYLIDAYRNTLRLEAVARTGQVPVLKCLNSAMAGPIIAMSISEESNQDDTVIVNMSMLVMLLSITNNNNVIMLDYLHGAPSTAVAEKSDKENSRTAISEVSITGKE